MDLVGELARAGVGRGDLVALAVGPEGGLGLAAAPGGRGTGGAGTAGSRAGSAVGSAVGPDADAAAAAPVELGLDAGDRAAAIAGLAAVERELRPRWVWWSNETARALVDGGLRVAACWDLAAVHRLLAGGLRADPGRVWALVHGLPPDSVPADGPLDLFSQADDGGDPEEPVRADGHLRPDWVAGGWAATPARRARWAALALGVAAAQRARLADLQRRGEVPAARALATVRAESAAELLCAELSADGLPVDRAAAESLLAELIGPRPRSEAEAARHRARRDAEVLAHVPDAGHVDLRSPVQVRALLRRVGLDLPDTRAWRLEAARDAHPVVGALLAWRKAERVATTYGYGWLDAHVGADGRLRGAWTGADGAAGRMTASGGLHNLPADLRVVVVAEPGHVFVRADLGQIEPRVLAAVAGDRALAAATAADDLYAPVAAQLGVDRDTAKVAVLGALYGQTSGGGAAMQRRLAAAYPVAMRFLEDADRAGRAGRALRTYGGRLVRFSSPVPGEPSGAAAARGRYARNAMVQGAAAELFKTWAATVRARAAPLAARIVLCLHDELLVHVPEERGEEAAGLVADCLQEAAHRWAPDGAVRFVADIAVIRRWSDAKPPASTSAGAG
ncbi:MAG TPA: DNA polymerase [Acidimicrobiales bacterium]